MKVSVIIPALNEAARIRRAIESVRGMAEVTVVDGHSTDETRRVAREAGAAVITERGGRGAQMDAGARAASGEVVLFLHADTVLPAQWHEAVLRAMADPGVVAGGFGLAIDTPTWALRVLERMVAFRARWLGLIYGDQALFARREPFTKAGGFRKLPLMEDVDCVNRLKRLGKVVLLRERVVTSSRRWAGGGAVKVLANSLKNLFFLASYYSGVPSERLYQWYYGRKATKGAEHDEV